MSGRPAVYFADSEDEQRLMEELRDEGFDLSFLDGRKIDSEKSFFVEVAGALQFPDYFGHNWDALYDCLGDRRAEQPSAVAVLWRDADASAALDLRSFCRCLYELVALKEAFRRDPDVDGLEKFDVVFLLSSR